MKNKKGAEKYLSIWWFFCLGIVLVGIVIALSRFTLAHDVSGVDANNLADRVLDCVIKNGKLIFETSELSDQDILSLCRIEFRKGRDYFLSLELYDFDQCRELDPEENKGKELECYYAVKPVIFASADPKIDLIDRCTTLEGIIATYMPNCAYKSVYIEEENKRYILRIIGGTYER